MNKTLNSLPKNKYYKNYFIVEIIDMHNPSIVHSVQQGEIKELQLFKYTIVDGYGNQGELVSWGEHIGYRTGERIRLRDFLVKEFRGQVQLVRINRTEINKIEN